MALTAQEVMHRELVQRSQDRIAVHNPTKQPFTFIYDRYRHTIPSCFVDNGFGKGNAIFPRYLALHYIKKMTDAMIMEKSDNAVREENERRVSKGTAPLEPWKDQEVFEGKYRADNESLREEIFAKLFLGVYEDFSGGDVEAEIETEQKRDQRKVESRLAEKYNRRFVPAEAITPKSNIEGKKNKVINEVSQ